MKRHQPSSSPISVSVGAGLGVGLIGALALAFRFGWQNSLGKQIPDAISPAVFATRVINTPSGEIVYHTSGNGEPLFFLHGVFPGASSFEWSKIYPHFAPSHHVFVPDLIGFGESQRPRPAISAESQIQALAAFFRTTIRDPITIVASGLSANLALLLAARYPQSVARILMWMPLLKLQKYSSPGPYHQLSWCPPLARTLYKRQWSTEGFIKEWLLRSGFFLDDPFFEEVASVLSSTAQQYGAEHAFVAQNSSTFWKHLSKKFSPLNIPISLLVTENSERATTEAMIHLRPYTSRFSIHKVETISSLAPLVCPELLIKSIEHELNVP